jgi:D-xylose transport system permease protein
MRSTLEKAGFDARFSALVLALAAIWLALAWSTDGVFLSPRNLYNLSIQTCVTAVLACGMVFLIVARQIDLSAGSQMAFTGMLIAWTQTNWLGIEGSFGWLASIGVGLLGGLLLGAFQGWWVAYRGVPAFVVTLAGFLMFRGAAFLVADGQTLAPLADDYLRLGGGPQGAIGPLWSWLLAGALGAALLVQILASRRSRARYGAPLAPGWADALKFIVIGGALLGFVAVVSAYQGKGLGLPVLILLVLALLLDVLARRMRFGRHVWALGGNPEAALLSGLPTRRILMQLFMLMGALSAVAALVTTARLGSGTHSIGQMAELYAIAATVIGGTSLAGGSGSIAGAIVGALLIQTLDNGMVLLDVSSAKRQIFIGLILIGAVWFDGLYTRAGRR